MAYFELMGWKKTDWDFVGKRYIAFTISGIMLVVGLAAMGALYLGKAPLGIDFSGGLAVQARLENRVDTDVIRKAFATRGIGDSTIQQADSEKGQLLLIKVGRVAVSGTIMVTSSEDTVRAILNDVAGGGAVTIEGVSAVGPAVGRRLQEQTVWAVLAAIVMIMLYIWMRFEIRFGVAAAVATIHDVIVVLGIMWVIGSEFNLLMVTALLTLAGYSLSDTVVVYDRIRDNLRLHPTEMFEVTANRSINEILGRTAITGITTMCTLVALMVYGSPVTYDFALALILGILIGTYSSWYVASPLIIEWENLRRRRHAAAAAARMAGRK